MSRLGLPGKKPARHGFLGLGGSQRSRGQPAQQGSGAAGGRDAPAAAATASAARPSAKKASRAASSDSWGDTDDEKQQQQQQQQVPPKQQQQQQQINGGSSARQPAGFPAAAAQRPPAPAEAPQHPPQPPGALWSHPASDIYDISSSSDADDDFRGGKPGGAQPRAGAPTGREGSAPALDAAPLAGCPICGASLGGQPLEQRQQHVNACCDVAAGGGTAKQEKQPQHQKGQAAMNQGQLQHVEADAIPAHRPCFQQLQQPPPPQQQQQGGPRQQAFGGAAAAAARKQQQQQPPAMAAKPAQQQQQQQHCTVCGTNLSHLRLQEQVSHIKACMAGRGGKPAARQPQQAQQQQPVAAAAAAGGAGAGSSVEPAAAGGPQGIREWLKGLGLERYTAVFEEQEIDLTCVHAVSAEELASIGVADRLHQARIMQAADALASALRLRRLRTTAAGMAGGAGNKPAAAKRQRQLTTFLPQVASGGSDATPRAGQRQQQQAAQQPSSSDSSMRDMGPRPQERALLASLYPSTAGNSGSGGSKQQSPPPQRTPQLGGRRMAARAAPAAASLWAGAGSCMPVAPTLGARLAAREAADPEGAAARKQPLARGGTAYPAREESRALKRVKLEALREELRMHEGTVAELRRMIAGLEQEVGSGG